MEDLKKLIRSHLNKVTEANVKQIAKATGHSDTEIINVLNAMRTYGEVECEQQGRGKGMMYWLTAVENAEAAQAVSDTPCCNAAKVMATTAADELNRQEEARQSLVQHNHQLERALDNAKDELESVRADLKLAQDRIAGLQEEVESRGSRIEALEHDLSNERCAARLLHESVQKLEAKLAGAKGFLIRAPKRKPRLLSKHDSAHSAAKSAKGEIFALLPVGKYVEKKVKTVEFQKSKAA